MMKVIKYHWLAATPFSTLEYGSVCKPTCTAMEIYGLVMLPVAETRTKLQLPFIDTSLF
jgi:hypothetical protein